MSGSMGKSESNNSSNNSFDQNVWGPQGDALTDLYGQANNLFSGAMNNGAGGKGGKGVNGSATTVMDQASNGQQFSMDTMNSAQDGFNNQLQGGAYGGMDTGNKLMDSLDQSMNQPSAMQDINSMIMGGSGNNYADAMKETFVNDASRAQENMMQGLDARAAASGMSGGSRHGMATALGNRDINENLQRNMANTGFNTFDKDLDRKLNIAQQADQGTLARQQMMQQMLGSQNDTMNQGVNNTGNMMNVGNQQQMMPWQQMGAYSDVIGGPTVLSSGQGSSSGNSKAFGGSGGASKSK